MITLKRKSKISSDAPYIVMYAVSNDENGEDLFGRYDDYDLAVEMAYDYGFRYVLSQCYYLNGSSTAVERTIEFEEDEEV